MVADVAVTDIASVVAGRLFRRLAVVFRWTPPSTPACI
jgi:hypothetical protein